MSDSLRVIDCEQHIVVPTLPDLMPYVVDDGWRRQLMSGEFVLPPGNIHFGAELEEQIREIPTDPASLVAGLADNVECAILVPHQGLTTSGWLGAATAQTFVTALNDYIADVWMGDPRLRFIGCVAPHDPVIAAEEIRRIGPHPACVGIGTSMMNINMGHTTQRPILQAASELNLPVIVHPAGGEGLVRGPAVLSGRGPRTPEEIFTLLPEVAQAQIASLIFEGSFEEFPNLKVVFMGWGTGWLAPTAWKIDSEWRNLRHEVPWVKRSPTEYMADHVRVVVDASEPRDNHSDTVAPLVPETILMYGSDRPYTTESAEEKLSNMPSELRQRVAYTNALETFGEALVGAPA